MESATGKRLQRSVRKAEAMEVCRNGLAAHRAVIPDLPGLLLRLRVRKVARKDGRLGMRTSSEEPVLLPPRPLPTLWGTT